jgi:hypothetical protein
MKITNREIQSKVQILQTITQRQLPVKASYAIAKNINSINKELKIFESEKLKIINDFALKDESGNPKIEDNAYKIIVGKEEECNSKINELLDIEVDVEIRTFNINCIENMNFSPSELLEIDFMIVE